MRYGRSDYSRVWLACNSTPRTHFHSRSLSVLCDPSRFHLSVQLLELVRLPTALEVSRKFLIELVLRATAPLMVAAAVTFGSFLMFAIVGQQLLLGMSVSVLMLVSTAVAAKLEVTNFPQLACERWIHLT